MIVSGSVLSNELEILPNVKVMLVMFGGKPISTVTDSSGKFSINVPSTSSEIRFDLLGYQYDTISVQEFIKNGNRIELFPSTTELDEVVVQNNTKSKDNTLAIVLGLALLVAIGVAVSKSSPKSVKVKI